MSDDELAISFVCSDFVARLVRDVVRLDTYVV